MENFDDVEQEVMFHDADCVSEVVRELVEMPTEELDSFSDELRDKVMSMRDTFSHWDDVVSRKVEQKKQAQLAERHRLGFEE